MTAAICAAELLADVSYAMKKSRQGPDGVGIRHGGERRSVQPVMFFIYQDFMKREKH